MMQQGAALIGTESPELLMQEYHAIRRNLTQGYPDPATASPNSSQPRRVKWMKHLTKPTLMQQRDQFIANRIDETLGNDQLGLLFIGMLHRVEDYLLTISKSNIRRPSIPIGSTFHRPTDHQFHLDFRHLDSLTNIGACAMAEKEPSKDPRRMWLICQPCWVWADS